jgi:hypothetical protein
VANVGSATVNTVPSSPTASTARFNAASAHQRDVEVTVMKTVSSVVGVTVKQDRPPGRIKPGGR